MKHPRVAVAVLAIGVTLSACSESHQRSSESSLTATTGPTTLAHSCTVASQSPPAGTIAAHFPTALAFAPDGRLFYAERSGTVRVFQNGRSQVFATVRTVTTEPGGGYSERGLLGLTISPTFAFDRYVYAF